MSLLTSLKVLTHREIGEVMRINNNLSFWIRRSDDYRSKVQLASQNLTRANQCVRTFRMNLWANSHSKVNCPKPLWLCRCW